MKKHFQKGSFDPRESFRALSVSKKISFRSLALASVLALLIIQLNIFFAWTSRVGAAAGARGFFQSGGATPLRSFLVSEVDDLVRIQFGIPGLSSFFMNLATRSMYNVGGHYFGGGNIISGGGSFNGDGFAGAGGFLFFGSPSSLAMRYFIDAEVILITLAVFVVSLFLFQKKSGFGVALLRAFEITSLSILPLGIEIFFFDRFEYNVHASDLQVLGGVAWFTNADVLGVSSVILGITILIEVARYANRKSYHRAVQSSARSEPFRVAS